MIHLAQSTIGHSRDKNSDPDYPVRLPDILPTIKEHGFDGVEIWQPHLQELQPAELTAVRAQLRELQLRVPLISGYTNFTKSAEKAAASMQNVRQALVWARLLGAEMIRIYTGGDRSRDASPEQWQRATECLQSLCDEAATDGIGLCLHTHDWNLMDSIDGSLEILRRVQRPNCSLLYKPAYFQPAEFWSLEHLGPRTSVVQVTPVDSSDGLLADATLDYRAQMLYFARRAQSVWFSFTWLKEDPRRRAAAAGPLLRSWRDEVLHYAGGH